MTCEEKIKKLTEVGDQMAALLALQGGPPEVERWETAKMQVTKPPSAPSDPMEEWG